MKPRIVKFSSSIAFKFLTSVIPISLLGVLFTGVFAYYYIRPYILATVEKDIQTLGVEASQNISSFFKQRENDLDTIAEAPLFTDYYNNLEFGLLLEAETYRKEIAHYLLNFSKRTGVYHAISFVDPKGKAICSIRSWRIVTESNADWDQSIRTPLRNPGGQKKMMVGPVIVPSMGPTVFYLKPFYSQAGAHRGTLVLACSLTEIESIVGRVKSGFSGAAYLVHADKRPVLPSTRPEVVARSNLNLSSNYFEIPGTPWQIAILVNLNRFLKPLEQVRSFAQLLVLICGLLVAGLIFLRVRRLIQPIKRLMAATERLSSGNLSERVKISNEDEIGALSRSFNVMAESLQARTEELVVHVKQLQSIQDVGRLLLQKPGVQDIYRICLKTVVRGLEFEKALLYVIRDDNDLLFDTFEYDENVDSPFRIYKTPMAKDDVRIVTARSLTPRQIPDVRLDPDCGPGIKKDLGLAQVYLVPILSGPKVLGVVAAGYRSADRVVSTNQVQNLSLLCNEMGLALQNAELFEQIRASEVRFRTTLDSSLDGIVGLDAHFNVTTWNRGAKKLFGYDLDEILGRDVMRLFRPADAEKLKKVVLTKGLVSNFNIEGVTKDERTLELNLTWAGSNVEDQSAQEWSVVIRDVTEQKRLQSELLHAEKLTAIGRLISGVAHEINNPLTAVLGYAELLAREEHSPQIKEDLKFIHDNAIRCRDIVSGLLRFARKAKPKRKSIYLPDVIKSTLALLEYRLARTESIVVSFQDGGDLPPVNADFQQIEQVLVNLIQNACDAMTGMKGKKTISITAWCVNGFLAVRLADNGPGIPENVVDKVFEPFFTTKEEGKGTGLGLALSRDIIREHGGTISVESKVGVGTAFEFRLPIHKSTDLGESEESRLPPPVPNKRILVIDDESDLIPLMTQILTSDGDFVDVANGGVEGLRMLGQKDFDLVISDISMPDKNGYDILNAVKQMAKPPHFIFVTGDLLNFGHMEKIAKLRLPYISKPFTVTDFRSTVRSVLASSPG